MEAYVKKIKFLSVKLGLVTEEKEDDGDKYALLEIADELLKPEQLK